MDNKILKFENVGKIYRLGNISLGSLTADFQRWWAMNIMGKEDPYLLIGEENDRTRKGDSNIIWALKDISFDVNQGDVVGIIGKNGAGKSTLLKLLSRITTPSVGTIKANGKIGSLLEVGTGFHNDLTGRENIYINGSILGMSKFEINKKFDAIVDFAGVERYIDTPIKRYSSGMIVRLGFAVAAFLEPDILVVDEILAVGDAEFQKKATGKMKDLSTKAGSTVLFVSHNLASVKSLCNRGILLENGSLVFDGNVNDAIDRYLESNNRNENSRIKDAIVDKKSYIDIHNILINNSDKRRIVIKGGQQRLNLLIEGNTKEDFKTDPMLIIKTLEGIPVATFAEGHYKGRIESITKGKFKIERQIELPKFLAQGEYKVDLYLHHPMVEYQMQIPEAVELTVEGYCEDSGRALVLPVEGFMGLNSI